MSLGGATEAAIWSIYHVIERIEPDWISVPYGRPLGNQRFYVLKPDLGPCPVHTPGKLFIAGHGLAQRYWNNDEETAARFVVHPVTGERLYDTGDWGRYQPDGSIEFLGRQDTQVKLRGFRIELGEIETQLLAHPRVESAAVAFVSESGRQQLVGCFVARGGCHQDELRSWLADRVPEYMVPATLIRLDALPLTSNGKLDRKALGALRPRPKEGEKHETQLTSAERWICDKVATLLGIEQASPDDNFFYLGGDSITAIRLVNAAREAGLSLTPYDIFAHPRLRDIAARAAHLADAELQPSVFYSEAALTGLRQEHPSLEDAWPLTPLQQGIWFHATQSDGAGADPYHVQLILTFSGVLDAGRLRRSVDALLRRHRSLRASFGLDADKRPVQLVHGGVTLPWTEIDLAGLAPDTAQQRADELASEDRALRIPLDAAPLMRATLLCLAPEDHRLLLSQHHLLGDGWATTIFFRDLIALYRADADPAALPPPVDFGAYLTWHAAQDRVAARETWREYLDDFSQPTLLAPAADGVTPAHQEMLERLVSPALTARLTGMTRTHGITLASALQGVWGLMLGRALNREDVCFGTVSSARQAPVPGIEDMLGAVIATTPVRLSLRGAQPVVEMLEALQHDGVRLMPHAHLSLMEIHREMGVTALFDTLFTYENYPVEPPPPARSADDLPLTAVSGSNSNHYPLSIAVLPGDSLGLRFHYNATLLSADDVRRYADGFIRLLEQVVRDPAQPIARLDILTSAERARLLDGPRAPTARPEAEFLFTIIELQAATSPSRCAIVDGTRSLDYATLESEANRLAWFLISRGIGPGAVVALQFGRSALMVQSMLAVLKTGACFMPLDPGLPAARRAELTGRARCALSITTADLVERLPTDLATLVLDDPQTMAEIAEESELAPRDGDRVAPLRSGHPAYLIYTSGSTGRPKGVVVPHAGLRGLAEAQSTRLGVGPGARVLGLASWAFDAAVSEIAMALTRGATLVIAGVDERAGARLAQLLDRAAVTHATFTPTVLRTLAPDAGPALQAVIVAGEACPADLAARWATRLPLFNAYGPTEATVCATMSAPLTDSGGVPIGRAIEGVQVYVLDNALRPCQVGTVGEIYLGGDGLALGYLDQGARTAERFVASPFGRTPGQRLYRSGDLAAWRADRQLDFHGRSDEQVKIRGVRVEPGEVVATIASLPLVADVAIDAAPDSAGQATLAAYVVPAREGAAMSAMRRTHAREQVEAWREIEDLMLPEEAAADPTFDTRGWNSAYDDAPLSATEMRDYVRNTVDRVSELHPRRLLEIGCGAGLIGLPLLGQVGRYVGVDLSQRRIDRLRNLQQDDADVGRLPGLSHAVFLRAAAHEVAQLGLGLYDTIILPSVVQYFADETYLVDCLADLMDTSLAPGGVIFLGDIRHRGLQEALNFSIERHRAGPDADRAGLIELVRRRTDQEHELLLEPAFFMSLRARFPQLTQVEVLPKRSDCVNELSSYRYDVVLRTGGAVIDGAVFPWRDGSDYDFTTIRQALAERPAILALRGVSNLRTRAAHEAALFTLGDQLASSAPGVEPGDIWELAESAGYQVEVSFAAGHPGGALDLLFRLKGGPPVQMPGADVAVPGALAVGSALRRRIERQVREELTERLPSALVPQYVTVVDSLPLTSNGKLDRQTLRKLTRSAVRGTPGGARNASERILCAIVAETLSLDQVDPDVNFFHIGGDSISAIRLVSLAREQGLHFTERDVFAHPVLRDLASVAHQSPATPEKEDFPCGDIHATPLLRRVMERDDSWRAFHQASLLQVPDDLDDDCLRRALDALIAHHDMLRLRTTEDGALRVPPPQDAPPVEIIQRSTATTDPAEFDAALRDAHAAAVARLDHSAGRALVAVRFGGSGGYHGVLLVIHHFAVDGVSWRILAEDLARAYAQAVSGQPIDLGRKTTSFRRWSQSLADQVQDRRGELPFWQSTTRPSAPLVTAGRLDRRRDRMETARYVERTLPPELTTRLLAQVPTAFRARINDVLLTALALALARWRERTDDPVSGPLLVDLEGHGREPSDETQDLTRTVGWFTSLFPVRLDLGDLDLADAMAGGDQAGQALRSVKEQLRSVPHAGIGYGLLRHFDDEGRAALGTGTDPQIAFNYLGRFGSGQDEPFTPSRHHAAIIGGADPGMPLDHVVSLNCAAHETPAGPRLDAVWQFAPDLVAPHEMEALADLWMTALEALVRHCDRPGAGGPSPSDFDLITVDQAQIDAFVTLVPELEDVWPLTALQAGLLFHSQSARANDPYLVQVRLALAGRADPVRMQRALHALVSRHSILRVRLAYDRDARPVQLVSAAAEFPLRHIELDDDDPRIADQFLRQDRDRGFDMIGGPLIRAALIETPSQSSLLLTMHHLIVDGWSGAILLRELGTLYRHDGNGEMLPHPASFKPYLRWLATRNAETARRAWEDYLRGADASSLFSADSHRGLPVEASRATRDLSAELTAQVERFASANGLTTASAVQGVWALLLALLSGRDDLSIGVVSAGRSADVAEAAQIVGMLACTTPVRATLRSGESVRAFLQRVQAGQAAMIPHRQLPLPEIRKIAGGPLFNTVFAFENYPLQESGAGAPFAALPGESSSHYPLTLIAAPDSSLHLALRLGLPFGSETAAGLLARFERLLQEVVTDPDRDVARMDALLPGERGRLLELGEQPAPPLPPGTIVDLFEAQAARTPDNAAITDGDRTISYSALDGQANRLAWKLIAAGVAPGTAVAIKLDRCAETVVAILAVLKAGGAYLPIDPKLPRERCDDYLEQVQPRLILTTAGYTGTMAGRWRSRVVRMDAAETGAGIPGSPSHAPRRADRLAPLSPHHPAYLIFTSGSTGQPKAVVNTHRNLLYLYVATQARFAFDQDEVWTWFHSYAFDFSVWEIWGPLLRGERLVVVSDAVARDPRALLDLLDREQVTTFSSTPSAFRRLLPLNPDGSGLALRKLVLGGEACPADTAGAWSLHCEVHNGYGPTETTVFATMSEELDGSTAPPIGTPLPGLRLYVLDHRLAPSAVGVAGDIYLAGSALAQGYHDRPGLTATRFVASPFVAGERMYRTGDRGAWRADRTLVFHGRDDRQVKLRGFRIELGEIEASLSALDGIDQALVRVMGEDGHSRLVAWLVPAGDAAIDLGAVRQGLAGRLPGFMIPGEWHVIATVPLNRNGKVAFDALPRGSGGLVRSYVAPTTPEEEALCAIAAAVLGIDRAGLTDSFFDLGGDSLLAAQLSVQVSERLDRELPVATIFGHPVMAEMARRIGVVGNGAAAFAPLLTIRGQGALPPLFCLHPGTGLCWAYTNLLPILAPEQPLYGVQAQGFLPGSEPAASFGEVIDGCLSAIRSVRPHGPYHLAGWSFGGSVAYAVATRLRREGEEVARLLLFDAFPPEGATTAPASEPWTELAYGADLRAGTAIHSAATLREAARAQGHVFGSFTTAQLEAMAVVMENNSRLLSAAKLDYFDGAVTLFEASRATPGLDRSIARPDAWRALCASLTVIPVDAEHHHMLSPTVVSQLRGEI